MLLTTRVHEEEYLISLQHEATKTVLHEVMHLNQMQQSSTLDASSKITSTFVTVSRLDASTVTTICCLGADGTDTVGRTVEQYLETYYALLPIAQNQLVLHVAAFAEQWSS